MIHVYREIVTRTIYVRANGERKDSTPPQCPCSTLVQGCKISHARLLTLAKDQPTSLAGISAEDSNEILDAKSRY
jgi:hypothetical protein